MRNNIGIILGTFLPFHKGHEMLIKFANNYMENFQETEKLDSGELYGDGVIIVIMSSREQEPISGDIRFKALEKFVSKNNMRNIAVYHHRDTNAPQNPNGEDDVEFWNYWKGVINDAVSHCLLSTNPINSFYKKFVFSSENYGAKVAELIDGESVTFDKERMTLGISGTEIRKHPIGKAHYINDDLRNMVRTDYVLFGAESVGKTTMTRKLGEIFPSLTLQEYARPYLLEQEDKSASYENMLAIFTGQDAYEKTALSTDIGQMVNFLDTDIMSTVGYARMVNMDNKFEKFYHFDKNKGNRHYLVLAQDEVPYEHDVLRYGNGVRESADKFWIDLLEEYELPYTVIRGETFNDRFHDICDLVIEHARQKFEFERE